MMGSLHGGTTAAIFDQVGSWSVVLADQLKWSLSTNLSIIYMSTCPIGEYIIIVSLTLRYL
jgi:acyl-coenzyme A thioesterase PaaI-like protein